MRMTGALKSAGVATGDEVIVPAYDTGELARAVVAAGAVPVFADIDPLTYCLAPEAGRPGRHDQDRRCHTRTPLRASGRIRAVR